MIEAEFIRDMHNNYLILNGLEENLTGYHVKMLLNNTIEGLLNVELRCIDRVNLFYYDITSLKSITSVYESKLMKYEEIKFLLKGILSTLEKIGEYLLSENDCIINPEYIFLDNKTQTVYLCYLIGYEENVQEQLSRFMEYLMDKVDYKDQQAVILIYALYKMSREQDCNFQTLSEELNKNLADNQDKAAQDRFINTKEKTEPKQIDLRDSNLKEVIFNKEDIRAKDKKVHSIKEDTTRKSVLKNRNIINKEVKDKNTKDKEISNNDINNKNKSIKKNSINSKKKGGSKNSDNNANNKKMNGNKMSGIKTNFSTHFHRFKNTLLTRADPKEKVNKSNLVEENKITHCDKRTGVIPDEIENEYEVIYYGFKTYSMAVISIIIGIGLVIGAIQLKLVHNSFGTQIDIVKLFCCIIIITMVEVLIMSRIFDEKNQLTRMEMKVEYIDPHDVIPNEEILNDEALNYEVTNDEISNYEVQKEEIQNGKDQREEAYKEETKAKDILGGFLQEHLPVVNNTIAEVESQETTVLWSSTDDRMLEPTRILSKIPEKKYYFEINDTRMTVAVETPFKVIIQIDEKVKFIEKLNNKKQRLIFICRFPVIIGKAKETANICIEDTSVSRKHAIITQDGEDIFITDLNSTNGTYLNGCRMEANKPYVLDINDEVTFSKFNFILKEA